MKTQIILFGQISEIVGAANIALDGINDTDSLRKRMIHDFPKLNDLKFLISVNKKVVKENQKIELGSEIAFLPPFAGG